MMSWDIDPEVLIIEVESRPLLYAKTLQEYSNKSMKNNAWEDVTKLLSNDWDNLTNEEKNSRCKDVQAKWKHLRDNFRREYQAQKDVKSGQGAKKKKKKYRYFDQLLFLVPHVKDAPTSGNYEAPTNASDQNVESPSTPDIENTPVGPSTATRNISATPKKKIKKTTSSFEEAILKAINNDISESDEDRTFCLSLVQSLKKMNDDNKISAKIEILNVIRHFSNRSHNSEPYFSHPNSNFSLHSTPPYTQTTQQQYSQPTFTQPHGLYQQHSVSHTTPFFNQPSSVNAVHQPKVITILENRQYRPANSTAQSIRPQSAQSYFTSFNPNICSSPSITNPSSSIMVQNPSINICPSPSNTDLSSSTTVQSPLADISSPEEFLY